MRAPAEYWRLCSTAADNNLPAPEFCLLHTADSSTEITARPQPTEKEIQFILDAIAEYLQVSLQGKPLHQLLCQLSRAVVLLHDQLKA